MLRTHDCGVLRKKDVDQQVVLCGWADAIRVQGKVGFILLRDRYGITQCFIPKDVAAKANLAELRKESVLKVEGLVVARPENQVRKELATGEVEVKVNSVTVLNAAAPLPLELDESVENTEETRLKYRFLDLRRAKMQANLVLRHKVVKALREYLGEQSFLELETPILAKSTPEGARDYLVPSRVKKGRFYALPQSPQLFKQLFMIAGYDKYFQVARCFRDEDLRADRQPEFTQLDVELSFLEEEDVYQLVEGLMAYVWREVLGEELETPFKRVTYDEAMKEYGSDRPHLKHHEKWNFAWVVDFPMFEYNEDEKRWYAMHHPFTQPKIADLKELSKPGGVKARAYDLVLNGEEVAGGSIRNHDLAVQRAVFDALGLKKEEYEVQFGFLLNALSFGAPPHGGIAFGLDRLIALIAGEESIREVIAFPKNKDASDLMLDAPSKVYKEQLEELGLQQKK